MPAVVCRASLPAYREEPDILRVKCLLEPSEPSSRAHFTRTRVRPPCAFHGIEVEQVCVAYFVHTESTHERENRISEVHGVLWKELSFNGKIERIESKMMTFFKFEFAFEKKKRKKPRE